MFSPSKTATGTHPNLSMLHAWEWGEGAKGGLPLCKPRHRYGQRMAEKRELPQTPGPTGAHSCSLKASQEPCSSVALASIPFQRPP